MIKPIFIFMSFLTYILAIQLERETIPNAGNFDPRKISFKIGTSGQNNFNNWELSKELCIQEGMNFAYLSSYQFNLMLTAELKNKVATGEKLWISGRESISIADRYYWEYQDDLRNLVFKNWAPGHPISNTERSCIVIDTSSENEYGYMWTTENCNYEIRHICLGVS